MIGYSRAAYSFAGLSSQAGTSEGEFARFRDSEWEVDHAGDKQEALLGDKNGRRATAIVSGFDSSGSLLRGPRIPPSRRLRKLPNDPPLSIEAFDKDAEARVKSGELAPLPGLGGARSRRPAAGGVSIPKSLAESETAGRAALTPLARAVAAKLK